MGRGVGGGGVRRRASFACMLYRVRDAERSVRVAYPGSSTPRARAATRPSTSGRGRFLRTQVDGGESRAWYNNQKTYGPAQGGGLLAPVLMIEGGGRAEVRGHVGAGAQTWGQVRPAAGGRSRCRRCGPWRRRCFGTGGSSGGWCWRGQTAGSGGQMLAGLIVHAAPASAKRPLNRSSSTALLWSRAGDCCMRRPGRPGPATTCARAVHCKHSWVSVPFRTSQPSARTHTHAHANRRAGGFNLCPRRPLP
jgi:hypothetical protein